MTGILRDGQEIRIRPDEARKGDVVVIRTEGASAKLIVKRVIATEGDSFAYRSWSILINGEPARTAQGTPYRLNSKMLEMYAEEYPILPPGALLVMGNRPDGSYDSSMFGFSDTSDVVGVVLEDG